MTADNTSEPKATTLEIVRDAVELIDTLPPEERRRVIAMIAANYEIQLKEPPIAGRGYYRPAPKRKRAY